MISIIMASYKRPHLLRLSLSAILRFKPLMDYEIIVLNDGIIDKTESICNLFRDKLNIKYLFTGQRNLQGELKPRVAGFALNIGIKQAQGHIVILMCPETLILNNAINTMVKKTEERYDVMTIPNCFFFDEIGIETNRLVSLSNYKLQTVNVNIETFESAEATMPFLMALHKNHLLEIGGYDEDFIGYAGEDNDLIERLIDKGLSYLKAEAFAVHLYHGPHCDGQMHPENPAWVYNWNLFQNKLGIIERNVGREWGKLDG